jgi:RND family efflux transporter MFP subunit
MDRCRLCAALCAFLPLAAAAQPAPVVTVARPVEAETAAYDFPCRVAPSEAVQVRAPLSGVVQKAHVRAGDEVKAGDVLVELTPRNLKEDLALAEAAVQDREAGLKKADQALARSQKSKKGKADELDVARVRAERDLAAARLKVARAEVERLRGEQELARVKAPAGGKAVSVAAAGDPVECGPRVASVLATLARTNPVTASFEMDEATLLRMRERLRKGELEARKVTEVAVLLRLPGEKEFGHRGTLRPADVRADPKTRKLSYDATFPNTDGALTKAALTPPPKAQKGKREVPALVRLTCGDPRRMLLVPPAAVGVDERGKTFVFLVDERNAVEKRPVKLGPLVDGLQGIEEGINAADWVAIGTGRNVRDPMEQPLTPGAFSQDARLAGLRQGLSVRPVRVTLPRPGAPR